MNLFRCFAISFALSFAAACSSGPGTDFKVASPDGTLCVGIRAADSLTYTVTRHGTPVLLPSAIGLHFADGTVLGRGAKVTDARRETVERVVEAPFYRQARFTEHYNQLRLTFEGGYAVTFRVFDQGCAYRIETHLPGERTVAGEVAEFNFAGDPGLFAAYSDGLCNAYQSQYEKCRLSALGTEKPVLLPLAADCGAAGRVLVCEADLEAYPGMFLTPSAGGLRGLFAAVPDSCYLHERRCQEKVATRHDYIARVEGTRTYPWRILAVADEDRELPTNDLVYALAAENRIGDCSWVKPGKVAWEWWNDWGLTGVDFEPGINTRTYKAYIDFAADYGLEYVVLDEGWSDPKAGDVMSVVEQIDLPELVRYADAKGVGLMLWVVGNVLDAKLEEACSYYAGLGIRGFKVDFIDRDDQKAVELVYRLARVAAAHRLRFGPAAGDLRNDPVVVFRFFEHVGHIQQHVGIGERAPYETHHRLLQLIIRIEYPRRIGIDDLEIVAVDDPHNPVAGRLRLRRDNRQAFPDQRVHQGRFSHVRVPDDVDKS